MIHRLSNAEPMLMDRHGVVHRTTGVCSLEDAMRPCTLAQGMVYGSGACAKCWPGGAPWSHKAAS